MYQSSNQIQDKELWYINMNNQIKESKYRYSKARKKKTSQKQIYIIINGKYLQSEEKSSINNLSFNRGWQPGWEPDCQT